MNPFGDKGEEAHILRGVAGEMTQWVRVFVGLAEDLGSIPSTYRKLTYEKQSSIHASL